MSGVKGKSGKVSHTNLEARQARRIAGSIGGLSKGSPVLRSVDAAQELAQRAETIGRMASELGDTEAARSLQIPVPEWLNPYLKKVEGGEMLAVDLNGLLAAVVASWKVVGAKCDHDQQMGKLLEVENALKLAFSAMDAFKGSFMASALAILQDVVPPHELNAARQRLADAAVNAARVASEHVARGGA